MTREEFRREVRRRMEALSPSAHEVVCVRALGVPVFAWDLLTWEQLDRVLGAVIAVGLIAEELS